MSQDFKEPSVQITASHPVSLYVAGDYDTAEAVCREFCDQVGFCVTVTPTSYVYRGGTERGVIVGLINYPRFPAQPDQIEAKAIALGLVLREALGQESFTIERLGETKFYSWRAE